MPGQVTIPTLKRVPKDATNVAAAFEEAVRRVLAARDRSDPLIQTDTVRLQEAQAQAHLAVEVREVAPDQLTHMHRWALGGEEYACA